MSSLTESDVLEIEGLSGTGGRKTEIREPPCLRLQDLHDLLHPVAPLPLVVHSPSSRGTIRRDHERVTEEVGGTSCRARSGRNSEGWEWLHSMTKKNAPVRRRPARPSFAAIDNFQTCTGHWYIL